MFLKKYITLWAEDQTFLFQISLEFMNAVYMNDRFGTHR